MPCALGTRAEAMFCPRYYGTMVKKKLPIVLYNDGSGISDGFAITKTATRRKGQYGVDQCSFPLWFASRTQHEMALSRSARPWYASCLSMLIATWHRPRATDRMHRAAAEARQQQVVPMGSHENNEEKFVMVFNFSAWP